MTRRALLALSTAVPLSLATGCRRRQAFSGFAFVANFDGRSVAAVDLGVFAVAKQIPLNGAPAELISDPAHTRVLALTPGDGGIHEISTVDLTARRRIPAARQAVGMRLSRDARFVYVLCGDPRRLAALDAATLRTEWEVSLSAAPTDFDVSADGKWVAIGYGARGFIERIDTAARRSAGASEMNSEAGIVRFQSDSTQLIAANLGERMLNVYQSSSGRLIAKLPIAVKPEQFCFNADGGQLFVTGEGGDAVVIVYPYFTPQVGETVLAGRAPGAMAVTPELLFVANSRSGDVSILNIESRKVIAVAAAGTNPAYIAITPDNQYALVLNEGSGDMGVIWIPSVTRSRARSAALFTMIPVGSRPVSAAVVAV